MDDKISLGIFHVDVTKDLFGFCLLLSFKVPIHPLRIVLALTSPAVTITTKIAMASRLGSFVRFYNANFERRPIPTLMITNSTLNTIADVLVRPFSAHNLLNQADYQAQSSQIYVHSNIPLSSSKLMYSSHQMSSSHHMIPNVHSDSLSLEQQWDRS